ncbi:hypothetical protein MHB48_12235 [Psychrobacillus sp. FSL H8-0483]
MRRFIDDLAGAIQDILYYFSYFFAGLIIIGLPLLVIVILFNWISAIFI